MSNKSRLFDPKAKDATQGATMDMSAQILTFWILDGAITQDPKTP